MVLRFPPKPAVVTLLSLLLAACAATDSAVTESAQDSASGQPQPAETAASPAPSPEPEPVEYGNFTEDQLYRAIVSELGAQQGELGEAGENYFDLAFETEDLAIVQRAVQFASVNQDSNALMQLGLLWARLDPDNPRPHLLLGLQFLETGRFEQALTYMGRVLELGGNIDFSTLAGRAGELDSRTRSVLIENLERLSDQFPENTSIRISLVQLMAQNGLFERALQQLDVVYQDVEKTPNLLLLEAQIEDSMQRPEAALATLEESLDLFPDNLGLRLSYARRLIRARQYEAAHSQFEIMMEQNPEDWETLYNIGLLDLEMDNWPGAVGIFNQLIANDQRVDESYFYLGYIYAQQDNLARAIQNFRQVRIGTENFLAAQQQATRYAIELGQLDEAHDWLEEISSGQPRLEITLTTFESAALIQNGHNDRALALLDRALNKYPNETDLLFARVLLYDSLQDREGSERDLRQIIRMKPDDSQALNHLGYMLADQTTRYEEALQLLERAIEIAPDEPAIIDSLGWAQYKMGMFEEALANLRRAYAVFPDHEVASHLGEVLWQMGRTDEAREIWQQGLQAQPDSPIITEAMERLTPAS